MRIHLSTHWDVTAIFTITNLGDADTQITAQISQQVLGNKLKQ